MIGEAELRRLAAEGGHDLMSQDLDYCMGYLLHSIFRLVDKSPLIFKAQRKNLSILKCSSTIPGDPIVADCSLHRSNTQWTPPIRYV